jgi:hypothetical protein
MAKRRFFSSRLASDEITTRGYRVLTFAKRITIMMAMLVVTSGLDHLLTRWYGWELDGFCLACVESYDV